MRELGHFILHLRWHYQVGILSGGYLLGGLYADQVNWSVWFQQFANVHLMLFGGATAYNSYWDRDEGPIGGLKNPPPMRRWMWAASLVMQFAGAIWAAQAGMLFLLFYLLSMLFFWFYSTPHARWKGHPWLSLLAIGVSTGTNSFWMGYLAAGTGAGWWHPLWASVGVACVLLSLYPVSQIFQVEEDAKRGDLTLARHIGPHGVRRFFVRMFTLGIVLVALTLPMWKPWAGIIFLITGLAVARWVRLVLLDLTSSTANYDRVMRIKYVSSLAFVLLITCLLVLKHVVGWIS